MLLEIPFMTLAFSFSMHIDSTFLCHIFISVAPEAQSTMTVAAPEEETTLPSNPGSNLQSMTDGATVVIPQLFPSQVLITTQHFPAYLSSTVVTNLIHTLSGLLLPPLLPWTMINNPSLRLGFQRKPN